MLHFFTFTFLPMQRTSQVDSPFSNAYLACYTVIQLVGRRSKWKDRRAFSQAAHGVWNSSQPRSCYSTAPPTWRESRMYHTRTVDDTACQNRESEPVRWNCSIPTCSTASTQDALISAHSSASSDMEWNYHQQHTLYRSKKNVSNEFAPFIERALYTILPRGS